MLTVDKIDTRSRAQVRRFVDIPFRLYADCPQWVPPLRMDVATMLNRQKHPFHAHSDADFFIVARDGRDVGRLSGMENRPFNAYHGTRLVQFYLLECEEDQEAATALFERAFEWARERGMNRIVGPKGFGPVDGYGLLVEGFEHREMMTMMKYNPAYYPRLLEALGFEKEVDFVSCYIDAETFRLPERVRSIAERVQRRGNLAVRCFQSKRELRRWANRIGQAYNQAFVNNWEYYPLSQQEIDFVLDNLLTIASPQLIKIITHGDDVVGFLFAFHDVSRALQRARGRLLPFGIVDLMLEVRRTEWVALNGAGILPQFQGRGGNALLYSEIEKSVREFGFRHAELVQVAETTVQMRRDLVNLGAKPWKNHRVYTRGL